MGGIEQKGMTFNQDFCYFILLFSSLFLGGKRKWEKNNQSRGQKSCLSARSSEEKTIVYHSKLIYLQYSC